MEPVAIEWTRERGTAKLTHIDNGIAALVDELSHGVVITSFDAHVIIANRAARTELAAGTAVVLGRDGVVRARCPLGNRELRFAIHRSALGCRTLVHLKGAGEQVISAAVLPLRNAAGDVSSCAIVFSRTTTCDALMLGYFARRHCLTPAEERVLAALSDGLSAPQAAARMHVAVSTIRSHVRSICKKTRSRGVRQVLQRVALLPPVTPMAMRHATH